MADPPRAAQGSSPSASWASSVQGLGQGTLLQGRWRVERLLGAGGQATTYAGRDQETGQAVAIKRLRLGTVEDWKAVELFEREGRALAQLDHPAVPRYLAAFHLDEGAGAAAGEGSAGDLDAAGGPPRGEGVPAADVGGFYLVQELIDGAPLSQLLEQGLRATDQDVRRLLEDILEVLVYLHGLHPPVVHRDIKPSNLIRRPSGHFALIDFGAVQAALPAGDGVGSTIVGTAGYMAPEALMGRAGPSSDLYSLGATAIHVVTGHHPSELPLQRMRLQWEDLAPGLDARLAGVLKRLTEPSPEGRYKSAETALRALRARRAARPRSSAPRRSSKPAKPAEPPKQTQGHPAGGPSGVATPRLVAAGLLVLALSVGLGAFLRVGSPPSSSEPEAPLRAGSSALGPNKGGSEAPLPVELRGPKGLTWHPFEVSAKLGSYLTITGTIQNDTGQPLSTIQGRVRAYDAAGNLVGAADVRAWPSYRPALLPGESAPLQASPCKLSHDPARVEVRLTAEPAEAADASAVSHRAPVALRWDTPHRPGVDVEVRERGWRPSGVWRPKDAAPLYVWSLDVTNTGQRPLAFLQLEARGLDRDGQVVPVDGTLHLNRTYVVGQDPLPPGATTAVRLRIKATRPIHERRLYLVGLRVPH